MKAVAEALKALAEYVKTGFQVVNKRLDAHEKALESLTKEVAELKVTVAEIKASVTELKASVAELKVAVGSLGRRWGRDLELTVLEIYKHALEERGIEPGRVEKFVYIDDGRYYRPGARIEVDVYIHDGKTYLLEVKSRAELEDVEWFYEKAQIVEKILGRKADKLIIVAVNIDREALERAEKLGIDAIYGAVIE
ncbi:microtubule-binding protein [Pyrobaculum aerophilum]|uniref:Microtubule-binding protein n=2 Tax=Pyrobaculum aerophilum TaxID=13773 RepID=A0A371R2L2_9CREN|nr:microtubule-binding protein [Pyrobaculum aerophilum]RFA97742.1 microtubule-binding protein [Pyrobaculum aerophilum]